MRRVLALAFAVAVLAPPGAAQQARAPTAPVAFAPSDSTVPLLRRPWMRPVASLAVPGTGQLLGGQPRGVVFLATEIWLVARAVALGRDSRRERDHYRSLAYEVARRRFGYERRDGPFSYFEEMGKYVESGAYDEDPGPGFVPQSDATTYNGSIWRLARETYFENPDSMPAVTSAPYLAAVAFYQRRAIAEPYRWSWRDARLEQDVYRTSIRASDQAYQAATNYLGALLLNHLVSAVDALVSVRLGANGVVPRVRPGRDAGAMRLEWHAGF